MEYKGRAGTASSKSPWAILPTIFAAQPVAEEGRWAFGIGLTSPCGRSTELDEDSIFRYAAPYYTQLISVELAPTFATRFHERVSFGFFSQLAVVGIGSALELSLGVGTADSRSAGWQNPV